MKLEEYKKLVNTCSEKENIGKNVLTAFVSGGILAVIGQFFVEVLENIFNMPLHECYMYLMIILVIVSSILTGFGIFDKIVAYCKCGLIVPTTGFAHAMTSSAMDHKYEGLVTGIGANIFKMTGTIILYAIVSGVALALIKGVLL